VKRKFRRPRSRIDLAREPDFSLQLADLARHLITHDLFELLRSAELTDPRLHNSRGVLSVVVPGRRAFRFAEFLVLAVAWKLDPAVPATAGPEASNQVFSGYSHGSDV
jgi:hypothetical protein